MRQTREVRTGVPKSTMLFFLLVLVCPCLSWRLNSSPALSKMTTTNSLEISTGREHCQTTSCTEEGLFPEGGPHMMTGWSSLCRVAQLAACPHEQLFSKFYPRNAYTKMPQIKAFGAKQLFSGFLQQKWIVCWFFGFHSCTTFYSLSPQSL